MALRVSESNGAVHARDYSRLEATIFNRKRLSALRVMVAGAGALGNEVIKDLALLGVGTVYIVDRDVIESSNLTRSVLFCVPDVAQVIAQQTPKAKFAASRVRDINPEVRAIPIVSEIADVGLGVLGRVDLVFSCLDNELARLELSWACHRMKLILADAGLGATNYSSGMISIFPGAGPCYACRKGRQRRREMLQEMQGVEDPCWMKERRLSEQGMVSTTPVMASVVAGIQVEMGLRHLLDLSSWPFQEGRSIRVTLVPEPSMESFSFGISPECPLHESRIEDVVRLSGRRSDEISAVELILAAMADQEAAMGTLSLDWPLTVEAECGACHHVWQPMMRKTRFQKVGRCPSCTSADLIERETINAIDISSPLASKKLTELGLPLLHIHEISWGGSGERKYVEISGDWHDEQLKVYA